MIKTTETKKTLNKMLFIVSWIEKYEYWISRKKSDLKTYAGIYDYVDICECNSVINQFERKIMILKSVYFKLNLTL